MKAKSFFDKKVGYNQLPVIIILIVIFFALIKIVLPKYQPTEPVSEVQTTEPGRLVYPEEYKSQNLPELENAAVVDVQGLEKEDEAIYDITVISSKSLAELIEFYEDKMSGEGWVIPDEPLIIQEDSYKSEYTKGNQIFEIYLINHSSGESAVHINYR